MMPDFSATGINRSGRTLPSSSSCQRSNASKPIMLMSLRLISGWKFKDKHWKLESLADNVQARKRFCLQFGAGAGDSSGSGSSSSNINTNSSSLQQRGRSGNGSSSSSNDQPPTQSEEDPFELLEFANNNDSFLFCDDEMSQSILYHSFDSP